jgi:hypothetical protein
MGYLEPVESMMLARSVRLGGRLLDGLERLGISLSAFESAVHRGGDHTGGVFRQMRLDMAAAFGLEPDDDVAGVVTARMLREFEQRAGMPWRYAVRVLAE